MRKLTSQMQNEEDSTTNNTDDDQIQLGSALHGMEGGFVREPSVEEFQPIARICLNGLFQPK